MSLPEIASTGLQLSLPSALVSERRKALGAFYTPLPLAQGIARWAIRSAADRVLDPSAGEAVFLAAAWERLGALGAEERNRHLRGIEIDADAAVRAQHYLSAHACLGEIHLADFFEVSPDRAPRFDAVIGNPPYIRYHRFRGASRQRAIAVAADAGVRLSRLTNAWAPFLVHATRFLAPAGRLALVLPAELLHADYAAPVRDFLVRRFPAVTVITFEEAVFPGAVIDTVILMAEDGLPPRGLRVIALKNAAGFGAPVDGAFAAPPAGRWSRLRAPRAAVNVLDALRKQHKLCALSALASVDIGCVTGANRFFILTKSEARRFRLPHGRLQPLIGRPAHLRGAIVRRDDIARLTEEEERCLLLRLDRSSPGRPSAALAAYLEHGRKQGIHQRYKCRVRHPWYVVPGVRVPDAFLSYMSHRAPRIAVNGAGVSSTNLVHQITFSPEARRWARAHIAALHSSIAMLSFELEGRSYGGGVLKLETREAERVVLPVLDPPLALSLGKALADVDAAIRRREPEAASEVVDTVLLAHGVLDGPSLHAIRAATASLRDRRALRGRTSC